MTHQQSDAKEAYNHYYEFIVNCNPFKHTQDSYNRIVTGFIEKLSSDFLLHTRDKLPIISLKDAQRLWKEVDAGYFVWVLDKPFYAPTHKKIDRVNIENYLFLEHREILKKLEQVEPANPTGQAMPEAQNTASTSQKHGKAKAVSHFPLPQEAKVSNIEMCFLDNEMETVRITIQSQSQVFNFAQMGFLDKRKGTANRLWGELAIYLGGTGIADQKNSERINDALQAFFKTEQKLLNKRETFFKISKQTTSKNKITSQGKARECPSCQDRHNHFCKICKEESEHCQECHDSLKTHVDLAK